MLVFVLENFNLNLKCLFNKVRKIKKIKKKKLLLDIYIMFFDWLSNIYFFVIMFIKEKRFYNFDYFYLEYNIWYYYDI